MIEHLLRNPQEILPIYCLLNLAGGVGAAALLFIGYHLSKAMYDLDGDRNHINE